MQNRVHRWAAAACIFLSCAGTGWAQGCYVTGFQEFHPEKAGASQPGPMRVVAFGSSVTWGDGLHFEHTFRYGVSDWLAKLTGKPVELWTFAHSSAYLAPVPGQGTYSPDPSNGALNGNYPAVTQQADCAAGPHALGNADLVLLDGCINEVNAVAIVAPWTPLTQIKSDTEKYCGAPMQTALKQIAGQFPSAVVVVVGYWPIISPKSTVFGPGGTNQVASWAEKAAQSRTTGVPKPPSGTAAVRGMSREAKRNAMAENSEAFYQISKAAIQKAVKVVSASYPSRIFFAGLPEISYGNTQTVDPDYAYGAPKTHEWYLPVPFLWWVIHPDEEYRRRNIACLADYPFGADRLVCQSNAGFHPNVAGEQEYIKAIEAAIPQPSITRWKAR